MRGIKMSQKYSVIRMIGSAITFSFCSASLIIAGLIYERPGMGWIITFLAGMFIIPWLTMRMRRQGRNDKYGHLIFTVWGYITLVAVSIRLGQFKNDVENLWICILYGVASVAGHYMSDIEENLKIRQALSVSNTVFQTWIDKWETNANFNVALIFSALVLSLANLVFRAKYLEVKLTGLLLMALGLAYQYTTARELSRLQEKLRDDENYRDSKPKSLMRKTLNIAVVVATTVLNSVEFGHITTEEMEDDDFWTSFAFFISLVLWSSSVLMQHYIH